MVAAALVGVGVALRIGVVGSRERGLVDQSLQPCLVSGFPEDQELLVEHGQFLACAPEPVGHLAELAFNGGTGHRRECMGASPRLRRDARGRR